MNAPYCPTFDVVNCSQFNGCAICNISSAEIERKYNILPYCTETEFCISNNTTCGSHIYVDSCILSNNIVKVGVGLFVLFLYSYAHKRITEVLKINRYDETKQFIILSLYSIINLFIPIILIFTTYLIYLEYFGVCILSFIITCCCIPPVSRRRYVFNRNYRPFISLSHTMPITPPNSPIETPTNTSINSTINSIPEENGEDLPPAYADLENNIPQPTSGYQT